MNDTQNTLARFPGARIEHLLIPGTTTTRCGKDATTANRYPVLTRANSADRRPWPRCQACRTATGSVVRIETTARELQVGDVILTRFRDLRNEVTSAPRVLGGSGLVAFGLHRPGRTVPVWTRDPAEDRHELAESWDGRLHADSPLTVERRVAFSGPNDTPGLASGQASSPEAQEPSTEARSAGTEEEPPTIEELLAGDPWRQPCTECGQRPGGHGHFGFYCAPCAELPYGHAADSE
jgi:hypothetical protein